MNDRQLTHFKTLLFLVVFFISLALNSLASAAPQKEGKKGNSVLNTNLPLLKGKVIDGAKFSVSITTPEGKHSFILAKIKDSHFASDDADSLEGSIFLQGENRRSLSKFDVNKRVAADIIDGILRVSFYGRRSARPYIFKVDLSKSTDKFSVKGRLSHTSSIFATSCAEVNGRAAQSSPDEVLGITSSTSRDLSVAVDVDHNFYRYYVNDNKSARRNANRVKNEIRSVFNRVEAIYTSQLGIYINLKLVAVDAGKTRPYRATTSDRLLSQFRNYTVTRQQLGNADVYHLFTGKFLEGAVVGLAYVGATCRTELGNYSYGLSAKTNDAIQALVTAHEIGHNLGASHIAGKNSIMSPTLNSKNNQFLAESVNQILGFIGQYGVCLAEHLQ